jgi:protein gp37
MGQQTGIEWTDHTFNPWWGCVRVSPACQHCYAETFAKRTGNAVWGVEAPRRMFGDKHWREPAKWNRAAAAAGVRRKVFCASMADVFEDRPDLMGPRERLFRLIEATPMLDWLLLTKRPENLTTLLPASWLIRPLRHVWLGTTVENQEYAAKRLPHLIAVPASVRFVSYEPALGLVDFGRWLHGPSRIDWLIAGGESGPGFRAPDPEWIRSARQACVVAGVPFFFKQWGGLRPKTGGAALDGREWKQFPRSQGAA